MSTGISMDRVDQIIDSYGCQRHHLIAIMQDIQAEYKYLSPEDLERCVGKIKVHTAVKSRERESSHDRKRIPFPAIC